ncbi:hypothetical protein [Microbacterium album]|uniref:Uncharacterized protein n=1 Tax=Microbacterium album TaxID=2053191 RepID=A0A917MNR5_9MICO|nr:hypothetical protein [Microbacterium album]GGH42937.1 hypothetical protein GCM10010921_16480 [Microbacterium album]
MGAAAVTSASPLPELRLRLPGAWWQIPLHDRETAREAIRGLVRRQLPGDALAPVRIAAERRLLAGLEQPIGGDALALHVALQVIPGTPLPLSAFVVQPERRLSPAIGTAPAATMAVLERALESGAPGELHRFRTAESEVARRVRRERVPAPLGGPVSADALAHAGARPEDVPETVDTLAVEYYLTVPGTKGFLLVVFTAPLGALQDTLVGFFDALIRVAYWHRPETR